MSATEVIGWVQTMGFPIAAFLLIYFDLRATIVSRFDRMEERIKRVEDTLLKEAKYAS